VRSSGSGTARGTPDGDRLDVLATLVEAYEREHFPIDTPLSKPSGFGSNNRA
jgi:antitoxin component HigA of HigAB toxin-antitoxin module